MKTFLINIVMILFSNTILANETYVYFGIDLGKELNNEKLLNGKVEFDFEYFNPTIQNRTFTEFALIRGPLSKKVYSIRTIAIYEGKEKDCLMKKKYWEDYFIKKYNIKKEIKRISNTISDLFVSDMHYISIICSLERNQFIVDLNYDVDSLIREFEDLHLQEMKAYEKKREEKLIKENDLSGF